MSILETQLFILTNLHATIVQSQILETKLDFVVSCKSFHFLFITGHTARPRVLSGC